jgi:hypothetical protein
LKPLSAALHFIKAKCFPANYKAKINYPIAIGSLPFIQMTKLPTIAGVIWLALAPGQACAQAIVRQNFSSFEIVVELLQNVVKKSCCFT